MRCATLDPIVHRHALFPSISSLLLRHALLPSFDLSLSLCGIDSSGAVHCRLELTGRNTKHAPEGQEKEIHQQKQRKHTFQACLYVCCMFLSLLSPFGCSLSSLFLASLKSF